MDDKQRADRDASALLLDAALAYGAALVAEEEARAVLALSPYRRETLERLNEVWLATWEPRERTLAAFRVAYAVYAAASATAGGGAQGQGES